MATIAIIDYPEAKIHVYKNVDWQVAVNDEVALEFIADLHKFNMDNIHYMATAANNIEIIINE